MVFKFFNSLCLVFLAICLSFNTAISQNGDYFLTHYTHQSETIDDINFDIAQDNKGIICIANRVGILRFDGKDWEHINTPAAIFSLSFNPSDNTLYTGGYHGLGKLVPNEYNQLIYVPISDSVKNIKDIYSTVINDDYLYGLNGKSIVNYNLKTGQIKTISSNYSGELFKLFKLNGKVYVSTEKSGLQLVGEEKLETATKKHFDKINVEFVSKHPLKEKYIFGMSDNTLKIYENEAITNLDINDENDYLINSSITDGIWINDSLSAISTLKGGVIFINHRNNTIQQIVNYQSGLPDNEIFAFSDDSNGGIWVAHSAGFTRISPDLPFRNFNQYDGLEGKILSVINHNDSLFVGTSQGLFYLQKVKNYKDVVYYEKKVVKQAATPAMPSEEKKTGFLSFLKKDEQPVAPKKFTTKTIYQSKVKQELKNIRYSYKKIDGLSSKVLHFIDKGDRLFCSGLDGLFEIKNLTAKVITKEPIHTFTIAEKNNKIFSSTYNDQIKAFDLTTLEPILSDIFNDFKDHVQHIFEDSEGRIWFSSNNEIYYVQIENGTIISSENYPINNPYYHNTFGCEKEGQILFVNETGTISIDPTNNNISTNNASGTIKYLIGANGKVWIYENENWRKLTEVDNSSQLNLLSVFKNISYISSDNSRNHWVVTENNELYKLSKSQDKVINTYDLYLKRIKTTQQDFIPYRGMKFDQENNSLLFEFAQPEFSGILDLKYQYKLEGLEQEWSEWSGSYNIVSFPYLPAGSYTLKLRSKNILGVITDTEPIDFDIVPPYWKRPWFYAFEFTVLSLLLLVSVRLKKLGFKYQLASRLLALVTLIIIIEFIQTVAENEFAGASSPVFDFLIQVSIAIIVLPVESLIRKFIFKEKNVQILDFIEIKKKKNQ